MRFLTPKHEVKTRVNLTIASLSNLCPGIPKSLDGTATRNRESSRCNSASIRRSLTGSRTAKAQTTWITRDVTTAGWLVGNYTKLAATWSRAHAAAVRRSVAIAFTRMTRFGRQDALSGWSQEAVIELPLHLAGGRGNGLVFTLREFRDHCHGFGVGNDRLATRHIEKSLQASKHRQPAFR